MKKPLLSVVLALTSTLPAFGQHPQPSYSYLEIFDVETGTHRVVKEFPYVIEAPTGRRTESGWW